MIVSVFLLIAFFFVTGKTVQWQKNNARFGRGFDQMATVAFTTQAFLYLKTGNYFNYFPEGFQEANRNPPLVFYVGAVAMSILGVSFQIMSSANLFFFIALCGAVFWLAARRGGAYVGLIALGLLLSTRAIVQYLCVWNTDMGGAAMVAWTMVLLDDPNLHKNRFKMVLLGALLALGSLTRMTYFLFLWFPLVYVIARSVLPELKTKNYRQIGMILFNWVLAVFTFRVIVAIPTNTYSLIDELRSEIPLAGDKYRHFFTLEDIPFYIDWFNSIGPISLIVGSIGLVVWVFRDREKFWLPLIWLIVPMVAFAYFSVNATRLLLPALPALALFGAMIFKTDNKKILIPVAIISILFGLSRFGSFLETPDLTTPPSMGAGWEEYEATDQEIADNLLKDSTGSIVFIEIDRTRLFSHHMLPSALVFDNPDRPFFRFHYESTIKDVAQIATNLANSKQNISTIIVRHPDDMDDIWNHEKSHDFWKMTRMVGAGKDDFALFTSTLEKLFSMVRTKEPVWDRLYEYGRTLYRVRVYSF